MTTSDLLKYLDYPIWDYSKDYECKTADGYWFHRYKDTILISPRCYFHIATKKKSRGKGQAKNLIKHLQKNHDYMMTTIECDDEIRMEKFLTNLGFIEVDISKHQNHWEWENRCR